jgi:hypothetical protein
MLAKRRPPRTTALCAALLAVAVGAARPGRADDPRSDARAHYAKGLELAGQHGYEGALREFNAAYAISPQFAVLYNIGQAHVALGHTALAIDALTRYLRDGGDRVSPERRAQVERQLAWLRSSLPNPDLPSEAEAARATAAAAGAATAAAAEGVHPEPSRPGTLTVRCPEPGLKITLDGKHVETVAAARGVPVTTGAHHLVLALPGRHPTEQTITVAEATAAVVLCEALAPALGTAPTPSLQGPPVFSDLAGSAATPTVHARTVAYLLGGFGLAFGGTAIGVAVWNHGQAQAAEREGANLPTPGTPAYYAPAAQFNQDVDNVNRASALTVGLAVASVGLIAGGVYLWLRDRHHGERTHGSAAGRSWATIAPGGALLGGVW